MAVVLYWILIVGGEKPGFCDRIAGVRATLQKLLEKGDEQGMREACTLAQDYITDLEEAAIAGQFLQETYRFDPEIADKVPYFTPEEEEYARSGVFVEVA